MADQVNASVELSTPVIRSYATDDTAQFSELGGHVVKIISAKMYVLVRSAEGSGKYYWKIVHDQSES